MHQSGAAELIGVSPATIVNWEQGHSEPSIEAFPAILAFLGYDPHPEPKTLPERLLAVRRRRGWTIRQAADEFGVDAGTWGDWEGGKPIAWERFRLRIEVFLE